MTIQKTDCAAQRWRHAAMRLGYVPAALLLLGLCSCSSSRNQVAGDPFSTDNEQLTVNAIEETPAGVTAAVESAVHVESAPTERVSSRRNSTAGEIVQLSGHSMGPEYCPEDCLDGNSAAGVGFGGGHALFPPAVPMMITEDNEASQAKYPDEYIYDGGDRATSVHYTGYGLGGFDPEDAIAEYRDEIGERHIKKSNRVAVYSPRFAAVSVISTLGEGTDIDQAVGSEVSEYGVNYYNRTAIVEHQENLGSERVRMRKRASGLDRDMITSLVDKPVTLVENTKLINAFEDYKFIVAGELIQDEAAVIGKAVQAAAVWSHRAYPVLAAKTTGSNEVYSTWTAQELAATDDPDKSKGQIRLVKLADKHVAEKGEIVTFTIRYDNIGDLPVNEVVIMDNLTVRLSYVEGTATSDHAGKFVTEDNGAGSLILRWELDEPLAGGEGGAVKFETRVE